MSAHDYQCIVMSSPLPFTEEHALKCELAAEVLRSFGRLHLQVTGWSMLPAVWPGDTLVLDRKTASEVSEGDIVLYRRNRRLVAHRVIQRLRDDQVLTRGDAMVNADTPIDNDHLLGRVAYVVRNGQLIEPPKRLEFSQRAVAVIARSSHTAARIIVGIHGFVAQA